MNWVRCDTCYFDILIRYLLRGIWKHVDLGLNNRDANYQKYILMLYTAFTAHLNGMEPLLYFICPDHFPPCTTGRLLSTVKAALLGHLC